MTRPLTLTFAALIGLALVALIVAVLLAVA